MAIGSTPPVAPSDAPQWATNMLQSVIKWVRSLQVGPQRLTGYTTALRPGAKLFPVSLAFDTTLQVPVFSDQNGNWFALVAASGGDVPGPGVFTTLSIMQGAVISGTYTPTLTNTANITSSTPLSCQYMRVGSVVTVSGGATLTPTLGATLTTLGISLPIASAFSAAQNCGGAADSSSVASNSAVVFADTANARATMQLISVGSSAETFYFSFTYQVI